MNTSNSEASPLDSVVRSAAPASTEAFALLSNETRLAILLALWDAFEPFDEVGTVPFTDLRKHVGMRDGSQFNYHLDKLVGQFVRNTDGGYELLPTGLAVVWSVITGTGIEDPQFDPADLDEPCPFCGARTQLLYEDAHLIVVCSECEGKGPFHDLTDGVIFFSMFEPTGLTGRTPEEIRDVAFTRAIHNDALWREGICPSCSGPAEAELLVCDNHEPPAGELCPNCERNDEVLVRFTCRVCKDGAQRPPGIPTSWHPAVREFYYERLSDEESDWNDFESVFQLHEEIQVRESELVSEAPYRLRLTFECNGDDLHLTINEGVNVVDVST